MMLVWTLILVCLAVFVIHQVTGGASPERGRLEAEVARLREEVDRLSQRLDRLLEEQSFLVRALTEGKDDQPGRKPE